MLYKIKRKISVPANTNELDANGNAVPKVYEDTSYVGDLDSYLFLHIDSLKLNMTTARLELYARASKIKIVCLSALENNNCLIHEFEIQAVEPYFVKDSTRYRFVHTAKCVADVCELLKNCNSFNNLRKFRFSHHVDVVKVVDFSKMKRF